jgi:hypothetical protein
LQSREKYVANPASIVRSVHPPVYSFHKVKLNKSANGTLIKNTNIDNLKYKGSGLGCFLDEEVSRKTSSALNVTESSYTSSLSKKCRENCMSVDRICPDDCLCRWFA